MVTFSSNAWHNFAKGKVIFKCKNDKPWKTEIGKMSPCPPCTILPPPFFNFSYSPPPLPPLVQVIKIYSPPFKKGKVSELWTFRSENIIPWRLLVMTIYTCCTNVIHLCEDIFCFMAWLENILQFLLSNQFDSQA